MNKQAGLALLLSTNEGVTVSIRKFYRVFFSGTIRNLCLHRRTREQHPGTAAINYLPSSPTTQPWLFLLVGLPLLFSSRNEFSVLINYYSATGDLRPEQWIPGRPVQSCTCAVAACLRGNTIFLDRLSFTWCNGGWGGGEAIVKDSRSYGGQELLRLLQIGFM